MAWIYLLLYQAAWWACALSGPFEFALLGPTVVVVQFLAWLIAVKDPTRELILIFSLSSIGIAIDSTLLYLEVLIIPTYFLIQPPYPPLWLVSLWISFAVGLRNCLQKMRGRYLIAALLGILGGPLAYSGGQGLGALALSEQALWVLGCVWAGIFPLFIKISDLYPFEIKYQKSS